MGNINLYRNIIMENYQNPSQFITSAPKNYKSIEAKIESCADEFMIFMNIENGSIKDILFNGMGCAISTASLNMLSFYLINMKAENAVPYIKYFIEFINGDKKYKDELKDLIVFQNIKRHLNRIRCGLLGAEFILKILENNI